MEDAKCGFHVNLLTDHKQNLIWNIYIWNIYIYGMYIYMEYIYMSFPLVQPGDFPPKRSITFQGRCGYRLRDTTNQGTILKIT